MTFTHAVLLRLSRAIQPSCLGEIQLWCKVWGENVARGWRGQRSKRAIFLPVCVSLLTENYYWRINENYDWGKGVWWLVGCQPIFLPVCDDYFLYTAPNTWGLRVHVSPNTTLCVTLCYSLYTALARPNTWGLRVHVGGIREKEWKVRWGDLGFRKDLHHASLSGGFSITHPHPEIHPNPNPIHPIVLHLRS